MSGYFQRSIGNANPGGTAVQSVPEQGTGFLFNSGESAAHKGGLRREKFSAARQGTAQARHFPRRRKNYP
jgi:hypothetical protein